MESFKEPRPIKDLNFRVPSVTLGINIQIMNREREKALDIFESDLKLCTTLLPQFCGPIFSHLEPGRCKEIWDI